MVNNIQEAYMERLENIVWMDSITRQSAIDKLQSMHKFIAYPDWFEDTSYSHSKLKIVSINYTSTCLFKGKPHSHVLSPSKSYRSLKNVKMVVISKQYTYWVLY